MTSHTKILLPVILGSIVISIRGEALAACRIDGIGEVECQDNPTAFIQSFLEMKKYDTIASGKTWFNIDLQVAPALPEYDAPTCTDVADRILHNQSHPWLAQSDSVAAVNAWHFDMVNDRGRNDFYFNSIKLQAPGKRVLVLGSGSGILDLMAWEQGAESVLGMEADPDLFNVACKNVRLNHAEKNVTIVQGMSRKVALAAQDKGDVLVSELFGNFLLSESMLAYIPDARDRLLKPGGHVIPPVGSQHAVLVRSDALWRHHSVRNYRDIKLQALNGLAYGSEGQTFDNLKTNFEDRPYRLVSPRVALYTVDFNTAHAEDAFIGEVQMVAQESGPVHALVFTWEALGDDAGRLRLDTHLPGYKEFGPDEDSWHRNTEWARPFLWLEEPADPSDSTKVRELFLQQGEALHVKFFADWRSLNVTVERARRPGLA